MEDLQAQADDIDKDPNSQLPLRTKRLCQDLAKLSYKQKNGELEGAEGEAPPPQAGWSPSLFVAALTRQVKALMLIAKTSLPP